MLHICPIEKQNGRRYPSQKDEGKNRQNRSQTAKADRRGKKDLGGHGS
ncbi:protein of unknown function [Candidatus Nitrosotalea okcheonensis]|uniref:Uncharacterized protein n=1 Tax=Candidatus Nitrosotalea okcheonensis TaxID=1903276 RepID=A0A2H1FF49_9ARCH|nr:protein of unknown function [Candidatus Nitrosotalea okcheonensis]